MTNAALIWLNGQKTTPTARDKELWEKLSTLCIDQNKKEDKNMPTFSYITTLKALKNQVNHAKLCASKDLFDGKFYLALNPEKSALYIMTLNDHQLSYEKLTDLPDIAASTIFKGHSTDNPAQRAITDTKGLIAWIDRLPARLVKEVKITIDPSQISLEALGINDTFTSALYNDTTFPHINDFLRRREKGTVHAITVNKADINGPLADLADWNKYRNRKVALEHKEYYASLKRGEEPDYDALPKEDRSAYFDLRDNNTLYLSATEGNTYAINISTNLEGLPKIAFPADDMHKLCKAFDGKHILMEFTSKEGPAFLTDEGDSRLYIIMPMKIDD